MFTTRQIIHQSRLRQPHFLRSQLLQRAAFSTQTTEEASFKLKDGEFIDKDSTLAGSTFLSQPLGSFQTRRRQIKGRLIIDDIEEIEISKETLLETQNDIKSNISKFTQKLGLKKASTA